MRRGAVGLIVSAIAMAGCASTNAQSGPVGVSMPVASSSASPFASPSSTATESFSSSSSPRSSESPIAGVESLRAEVIESRPHDVTSYTEGLALADGRLFESSERGATLREEDPETGAVLRSVTMDGRYSGEGIAVVGDQVVQLTLSQHTAIVYGLNDFQQVGTYSYDTDGWGLCDDGTRFVLSDGTSQLYFRDQTSFALLGTVTVTNDGTPVDRLNELECVNGEIYANVWLTDTIVRIDPSSGRVDAVIDASGLLAPDQQPGDEDAVLNGIAYDPTSQTFLLTGKLWPEMFEVRLVRP
jgi:glutamine cyclotransferase